MNRELLSSSASTCATNSRFFSVKSSNTFCRSAKSRAEFALRNVRAHANAKRKREDTHKDNVSAVKKIKTHIHAHSNDDKREKTEKKKKKKKKKNRKKHRRPRRTHPIVKQFSNFSKASLKRSNSLAKIFLLLIFSSTDAAPPLPLLDVVEQQHSSNASEAF